MTQNIADAQRPSLEKLLEAAPMLCRASFDVDAATLASSMRSGGREITPALRDELLAKCKAGEHVELDVPMLAFEQQTGVDNRNFVGFRDGSMLAIGRTGRGKPFLRDHEQYDSLARGGTLIESKTETPSEGHYQIRQTARLTAPWAVELALRGLMSTVSIGWHPTGPVLCSACDAPVLEQCWHFPGDRVAEFVGDDGKKRKRRDRNGTETVRWIYTAAELIETSCVPVPAVPTAQIDALRSTLAARFPSLAIDDDFKSPPAAAARSVDPQPETQTQMANTDPNPPADLTKFRRMLAAALALPEEHRAHALSLDDEQRDAFLGLQPAGRHAAVQAALAADPVVFTGEVTGLTVRQSEGPRALQLAQLAESGAAANKRHEAELAAAASRSEDHEIASIRAARLSHLPGSDEVHTYIVRSLRKGGGAAPLIESALAALTGANEAAKRAGKAPGVNENVDPAPTTDALGAFESELAAFAKAAGKTPAAATEDFLATDRGGALYDAYDKARRTR